MYEFSQSPVDNRWRLWKKVDMPEEMEYSSGWIVVGVYDFLIDIEKE